jgi:hypothetical protein
MHGAVITWVFHRFDAIHPLQCQSKNKVAVAIRLLKQMPCRIGIRILKTFAARLPCASRSLNFCAP